MKFNKDRIQAFVVGYVMAFLIMEAVGNIIVAFKVIAESHRRKRSPWARFKRWAA